MIWLLKKLWLFIRVLIQGVVLAMLVMILFAYVFGMLRKTFFGG